jgi:hypothetical protein
VLEMGVGVCSEEEESPWSSLALEDQMKSLKNDMDQVMSRLTINNFAITSPPRSSLSAFADGSEGCDPLSYGLCTDDLPPPPAGKKLRERRKERRGKRERERERERNR